MNMFSRSGRVAGRYLTLGFATLLLALAANAGAAYAAPPNDNFIDAQVLSGALPIAVTGTNVDGTHEVGEPAAEQTSSVWFSWTPTAETAGPVALRACNDPGSSPRFDGNATVYTGDSVADLIEIGRRSYCDRVVFEAEAGVTYWIAVADYWYFEEEAQKWLQEGRRGSFILSLVSRQAPANDNFVDAQTLDGTLPFTIKGTNVDATNEIGSPNAPSAATVWYSWTPTAEAAGPVGVRVCNDPGGMQDFEGRVAVYTGATVDSLTYVTAGWSCSNSITFTAVAGTKYSIVVDDGWIFYSDWEKGGWAGDFELRLRVATELIPPTPVEGDPPVVTGEADVGAVLSCNRGGWTGNIGAYEYEWTRTDGSVIEGASQSSFTTAENELGQSVGCRVRVLSTAGTSNWVDSANRIGPVFDPFAPISNTFNIGKPKLNKKKGTATIQLALPGAGKVELLGSKTVKKAGKTAAGPGNVKLAIKAKGKAAKKLKKKGKAKVQIKVRFTPDGGQPKTVTKKLTLKRKR